jgi:hypothetical protein
MHSIVCSGYKLYSKPVIPPMPCMVVRQASTSSLQFSAKGQVASMQDSMLSASCRLLHASRRSHLTGRTSSSPLWGKAMSSSGVHCESKQMPTVNSEICKMEGRQDADRRCAVKPMSWPNAASTWTHAKYGHR